MPKPAAMKPARCRMHNGTRQVAKPELVDEGEHQHRVDGDQPQGIEKPR